MGRVSLCYSIDKNHAPAPVVALAEAETRMERRVAEIALLTVLHTVINTRGLALGGAWAHKNFCNPSKKPYLDRAPIQPSLTFSFYLKNEKKSYATATGTTAQRQP